jgi:hypothetical protein
LDQVGVHDYDAASNLLIIKEIASLDFTNLFHHVSPSFYLLHVPVYLLFQDFLSLEYFNTLLNLLSFYALMYFFGKELGLGKYQQLLFIFFGASGTFMIYSSRCISISNLSLLLFVIFLGLYYKSFTQKKYWLWAMFIFALTFTVNYKVLLFIPILFCIELLQKNRKLTLKDWFLLPFFLGLSVILYSILGYFLNSNLGLNYLGKIYSMFFIMSGDYVSPAIGNDYLYYVKYLFYYENILILPSIILFVYFFKLKVKLFQLRKLKITALNFIFLISIWYLVVGIFLPKAPRLLLFVYPFLYLMAFLSLKLLIKNPFLFVIVLFSACFYNLWNSQRYIYHYAQQTNYPKLVEYLQKNKIDNVISTTGINLSTFLPTEIHLEKAFTQEELIQKAKEKNSNHILIDNYYLATNHQFDTLKHMKALLYLPEKILLSPYLFLEHSEYTGLSFDQTQTQQKKAAKDNFQLRLINYSNDTLR